MTRAASMTRLDPPSDRDAARLDPSLALICQKPHLVDEWQKVPEVWDAARRAVDASGNERGMLLLTGSTALNPSDRPKVHHSGTGREAAGPQTLASMTPLRKRPQLSTFSP